MSLRTPVCELFGLELPIFSAGMGIGAGAALAAAVSTAGGCRVVGSNGLTNGGLQREIRRTREMTSKPFGVNVLPGISREGMIEACIEERPPIIVPTRVPNALTGRRRPLRDRLAGIQEKHRDSRRNLLL